MDWTSTWFGAGVLALLLAMGGCSSSRDWVVVKRIGPPIEDADVEAVPVRPLLPPVDQDVQATFCKALTPGIEAPGLLTCGRSQIEL
jgi:hypothetical protein